MADHEAAVRVANAELATVREAMRGLMRLVDALERGELEKVVLTQRNRMRAAVVSLARFSELERQAALDRRMAALGAVPSATRGRIRARDRSARSLVARPAHLHLGRAVIVAGSRRPALRAAGKRP